MSPFSNGGFVGRAKATKYVDRDEWRTYDVTADGGHFVVKIDGETVLDYTDPKPLGRGRIGLQLNSGPVAFRNIKLKPLGLEEPLQRQRPGRLEGSCPNRRACTPSRPKGRINVKNGKGQLESDAQFGDFMLQLEMLLQRQAPQLGRLLPQHSGRDR